ncbi:MAG: hypothetical protein ACXVBY_19330, partial [Isosphaeraceae bacterium]
RSNIVTKTLRFQALALVASMGLCAALISGCNPEEPAKPTTPGPAPTVTKPAPPKTAQPAPVAPPKTETEKK